MRVAMTDRDTASRRCVICGAAASDDVFAKEGFYKDTWIHLRCLNSSAAREWRRAREASDPRYRRYLRLVTIGLQVACDACGSRDNYIYPKATGFSPAFEVSCDRCGAVQDEGLDRRFFPEAIASFLELRDAFVKDTMPPEFDERVGRLARENDHFINPSRCTCGGHFSLAAKPRCRRCRAVILDSYFHYVDEAPDCDGS
jgi:hypothetical protein